MAFDDTTLDDLSLNDGVGNRSVLRRFVNGFRQSRIAIAWLHGFGGTGAQYENSKVNADPGHVDYFPTAQTIDVGSGPETKWATPEDDLQNSAYAAVDTDRDLGLMNAIGQDARSKGAQWVFFVGFSSGAKLVTSILSNPARVATSGGADGIGIANRGALNAWVPVTPMDTPVVFRGSLDDSTRAIKRWETLEPASIGPSLSFWENVSLLKYVKLAENPTIHRGPGLPFVPYFIEDSGGVVPVTPPMTLFRYGDVNLDILTDNKGHDFTNDSNYRLSHVFYQLLKQQARAEV